jgi:hypothetical protein
LFSLIRLAKEFEFLKENEQMRRSDIVIKNELNQKLLKCIKDIDFQNIIQLHFEEK